MRAQRYRLVAQRGCRHGQVIVSDNLTRQAAEKRLELVEATVFCQECWSFVPVKHRWTEPRLF